MSIKSLRPLTQGALRACALGFAVVLPLSLAAHPLALSEAERLALANEPGLERLHAEARAREDDAVAAGLLPNPVITTQIMDIALDRPGFDRDPMTQMAISVRQSFPRGASRWIEQQQRQWLADSSYSQSRNLRRQILRTVRQTYLELYFEHQKEVVLDESQAVFEQVLEISQRTFAAGLGSQQDILRAELELERLADRLTESQRQQSRLRAGLARWLDDRSLAPMPTRWPELPSPLNDNLDGHPILAVERAEVAVRQESVALAEQNYRPQWSVELGYGYRTQPGVMNPHRGAVMLMMDMPLFTSERQDRTRSARQQEYAARQLARDEQLLDLRQALSETREDWERLLDREARYRDRLVPVAEDNAQAAEQAYASGIVGFSGLMDARLLALNNRIEYLRIRVDRLKAQAGLLYLLGEDRT